MVVLLMWLFEEVSYVCLCCHLDWKSGKYFLKSKLSELTLEGRQLTIFVAADKIQLCNPKLEFCRTCVCYFELDSFPIFKEFSGEINGDSNNCGLGGDIVIWDLSPFGRSV